jgi:hypothetical protein
MQPNEIATSSTAFCNRPTPRLPQVLLALTRVGHYSAPLSAELAELAAGARAPPGGGSLADLLAPRDARRLLRLMAAALEEAPPGPGAVLV